MSEQNKRTTNQGIPPTGTPVRSGPSNRTGGAPTPPTGFRSAGSGQRRDDRRPRRPFEREQKEFEEKMISINRVSKTTKGGRMLRFAALVVIGDKKGRVGFGTGKAAEVPDAMKKAIKNARKSVYRMKINKKGTIHHQVTGRHGASSVLLKPAPDGTGIVAGGAIRAVIELAGYTNVYTKNLGAKSPLNMVRATVHGLQQLRTPAEIAKLRDKELSQL